MTLGFRDSSSAAVHRRESPRTAALVFQALEVRSASPDRGGSISGSGPKFDAAGVRDHVGNRQSWLSFSFGIAAIVFVVIDLIADHQTWAGVAAVICILLGMLTRPSGFFGQRGPD